MESIERLRKQIERVKKKSLEIETTVDVATSWLDEIESEISERYMELPVDADRMPIHVGDKMRHVASKDYFIGSGEVVGYSFKDGEVDVLTQASPAPIHSRPNMLRHVKPDPIKELLEELAIAVRDGQPTDVAMAAFTEETYIRIRAEIDASIRKAVEK